MPRPYKCPYCGNQDTVSKGRRRTKTMGDRCIRLCKACRRKFTPRSQKAPDAAPPASQPLADRVPAAIPAVAMEATPASAPGQAPATRVETVEPASPAEAVNEPRT